MQSFERSANLAQVGTRPQRSENLVDVSGSDAFWMFSAQTAKHVANRSTHGSVPCRFAAFTGAAGSANDSHICRKSVGAAEDRLTDLSAFGQPTSIKYAAGERQKFRDQFVELVRFTPNPIRMARCDALLAPSLSGRAFGDFCALLCGKGLGARCAPFLAAEPTEFYGVRIFGRIALWRVRIAFSGFARRQVNDPLGKLIQVARSARALLHHAPDIARRRLCAIGWRRSCYNRTDALPSFR